MFLHQRETDANASDYYRGKLNDLMFRFRQTGWFYDGLFIANETAIFPVNEIFRELEYDNDPLTCWSPGVSFETFSDNVHFAGNGFVQIGNEVSDRYLARCFFR